MSFNIKDYGAVGDGNSHPLSDSFSTLAAAQAVYPHATSLTNEIDWAAFQKALNILPYYGGMIIVPHGSYYVNKTITLPSDAGTTGRTVEIAGEGEAALRNLAPPGQPTFEIIAANGAQARGIKMPHLILLGDYDFPNNGIHIGFLLESEFRDLIINMNGNAVLIDGGVFGLVFDTIKVWPTGRTHGATGVGGNYDAFLFDTPAYDGSGYAHTITFKELVVENGGRAIRVKSGWSAHNWDIGRVLAEGLTGGGVGTGTGWALDLDSLRSSRIGPIYSEFNTPGTNGDVEDKFINITGSSHLTFVGGSGTGLIKVRASEDISFTGIRCNKLDADSSVLRLVLNNFMTHFAGGAGAGYANTSVDRVCINVVVNGVLQPMELWALTVQSSAAGSLLNFYGAKSGGGAVSVPDSTTTTLFAVPGPGLFLIGTYIANSGPAYQTAGILTWDGTDGALTALATGANTLLLFTNPNVSIRQTSGVTKNVTYVHQRIA